MNGVKNLEPRIQITVVRFAGVATLLLVLGYIALLWQVIAQASNKGPLDSATLGAIGALGPLVGLAVGGMFSMLTRIDQPKDTPTEVTVHQPENDPPLRVEESGLTEVGLLVVSALIAVALIVLINVWWFDLQL